MKIYFVFYIVLLKLILTNVFKILDTKLEINLEKKQNIEKIKDHKIYYNKLKYLINQKKYPK